MRGSMRTNTLSVLLPICFLIPGCGAMKGIEAATNRAKLDKLQIGMTEDEVRAVMGKPYRTEATHRAKVWLYITEWQPDSYTTADEMTALVFENGKLVAWGAAPEQLQKYEIRLR